jgi:hypothetical protein
MLIMETAASLIARLALQPHPEGGWYREVHRSGTRLETRLGARNAITSIYYLLERRQLSRWHVVSSDEVWHFHAGAPLELLTYRPATRTTCRRVLGTTAPAGETIGVVPAGDWQAARSTGDYTLVGCDVAPGFEFADFQFVGALPGHELHFTAELAEFSALL